MTYYVIDVESNGPILSKHSMVCFGAVRLDNELKTTFYGQTRPISDYYNEEALAISGFSRQNMNLLKIRKSFLNNLHYGLQKPAPKENQF